MAIIFAIPQAYEHELIYGNTDPVLSTGSVLNLTSRNINPTDLFEWERKQEEAEIPEAPGSIMLSDGFQRAVTMEFFGFVYGNNQDDTFYDLTERMATIAYAADYTYLRSSFWNGAAKALYRRYVTPMRGSGTYARKTFYGVVNGVNLSLRATDPAWYLNTPSVGVVNVVNGTGNKAITDTGRYRTNRVLIYITKTGASTPTNPVISNSDGHALAIAGTLASVNDYWELDMLNGTVKKNVSGVISNDIANMTGRFFGFQRAADTITCTSGGSATFDVSLAWLPKIT